MLGAIVIVYSLNVSPTMHVGKESYSSEQDVKEHYNWTDWKISSKLRSLDNGNAAQHPITSTADFAEVFLLLTLDLWLYDQTVIRIKVYVTDLV